MSILKDMSFSLSEDNAKKTAILMNRALSIQKSIDNIKYTLKSRQLKKATELVSAMKEQILNMYIQALLDYSQKNRAFISRKYQKYVSLYKL